MKKILQYSTILSIAAVIGTAPLSADTGGYAHIKVMESHFHSLGFNQVGCKIDNNLGSDCKFAKLLDSDCWRVATSSKMFLGLQMTRSGVLSLGTPPPNSLYISLSDLRSSLSGKYPRNIWGGFFPSTVSKVWCNYRLF